MIKHDDTEIRDLICNEISSLAMGIVDLESDELLYNNEALEVFMLDMESSKCWNNIFLQSEFESYSTVKEHYKELDTFEFEYFNDITNRWYQSHNKIVKLKSSKSVLVFTALDITIQKEAQGEFIKTQVKLIQQTERLEKAQEKLKLLAATDPMTKLYNRRYFSEISTTHFDLAMRATTPLSLIMIDIDHFKKVNDTYGHEVGDDVIIFLSNTLKEQSRKSDIVSRWGGEEFLILFPNTDVKGAEIIAQKIRKTIENSRIKIEDTEIMFTISIGLAYINKEDTKIENLIKRADDALYRSKEEGRNRVTIEAS